MKKVHTLHDNNKTHKLSRNSILASYIAYIFKVRAAYQALGTLPRSPGPRVYHVSTTCLPRVYHVFTLPPLQIPASEEHNGCPRTGSLSRFPDSEEDSEETPRNSPTKQSPLGARAKSFSTNAQVTPLYHFNTSLPLYNSSLCYISVDETFLPKVHYLLGRYNEL